MQAQKIGRSLMQGEAYFNAWNARDPEAVAAAFAEGGHLRRPDGDRAAADGPWVRCRPRPACSSSASAGRGRDCRA
jgi:hypothetical protein